LEAAAAVVVAELAVLVLARVVELVVTELAMRPGLA
jgi:hypothetical protein